MLHVRTASDLLTLADDLAGVLAVPPVDPMEREWVAVPSAGVRQWLALRLATRLGSSPARGDGVAANIAMPFPGRLRGEVLSAGGSPAPEADPWAIDRLVWAVAHAAEGMEGLPESLAAPTERDAPRSRYAAARHVADLFDRYGMHRPEMIRSWALGRDVDPDDEVIAAHHRWQPELWRQVRSAVGSPSPAERMPEVVEALRSGALEPDLPRRLAVFGVSTLPGGRDFLELARALAAHREVHLFLVRASDALDIPTDRVVAEGRAPAGRRRSRAEVRPADLHRHPLLRSWGGPHLETSILLADAAALDPLDARHLAPGEARAVAGREPTLLHRLQQDIRLDSEPAGDVVLGGSGDDSVQFHSCQGATRQVEVMRDVICHVLAGSTGSAPLEEDDVLVICPDLERFAPVIEAVLGDSAAGGAVAQPGLLGADAGGGGSAPRLRYRISDRTPIAANPVAAAVGQILSVVSGRFTASGVVDLLALPAVRARTGLDDDDLGRITEWVAETHIRWGRDAAHRARWAVGPDAPGDGVADDAELRANTWEAGVGRLLTGMAVATRDPVVAAGGHVPLQVEGSETDVLGSFTDFLWRLERLADAVTGHRSVGEWADLLVAHLDGLVSAPRDSLWQVDRVVETIVSTAQSAEGFEQVTLDFAEMRRVLLDRLDGIPGTRRFFRGGITVTSSAPLRWVPWRAIVLLGMDEAALSVRAADGDDLLADAPVVGDREARADSRQFVLEALMAAIDHFVVIRDGRDVLTNHDVPAAVPVAELQSVVNATVSGGVAVPEQDDDPRIHPQEVVHPRQAWSERTLVPAGIVGSPSWTFDHSARRSALRRRDRSPAFTTFSEQPLADEGITDVALVELRRCLRAPIEHFLVHRLGVRLLREADALDDLLPTVTSPLDRYSIGSELIDHLDRLGIAPTDEADLDSAVQRWADRELRVGRLPAGVLGREGPASLATLQAEVTDIREKAGGLGLAPWEERAPDTVEVDLTIADVRIHGEITCPLVGRPGPGTIRFSRPKTVDRVEAWLDLLLLEAVRRAGDLHTSEPFRWVAVRRNAHSSGIRADVAEYELHDEADPRAGLAIAVDLYRRSRREPLPLFGDLSPAIAEGQANLNGLWPGRHPDAAESAVYGDFEVPDLLALPLLERDGGSAGVGRVEHYAHRLWDEVGRIRPVSEEADDG